MLNRQYLSNGGIAQLNQPGDIAVTGEVFPPANTTTAITVTGNMLQAGWINRNPAAPGTDTLDSAANIIASLTQGLGTIGVQNGTSFRVSWYNDSANAITVAATANSGVTVVKPTINAGSVKEYIVSVINGTPAFTATGTATNGSNLVTGLTDAALAVITPGMVITNAVAGAQGFTVAGVNMTAKSITLSGNATATGPVSFNFSPVVVAQGIGQRLM